MDLNYGVIDADNHTGMPSPLDYLLELKDVAPGVQRRVGRGNALEFMGPQA